jgi:hypothetical protein
VQGYEIKIRVVSDAEHQDRVCLSLSKAKLEGNDVEDGLGTEMYNAERARLSPTPQVYL